MNRQPPADRIARLFRQEAHAIALYARAVGRAPSGAVRDILRRLLAGHRWARQSLAPLTKGAHANGEGPGSGTGGSGPAAGTPDAVRPLESRAIDEGDLRTALDVLRSAEADCLEGYSDALCGPDLAGSERLLLVSVLLPEQRSHDALLNRIDDWA